LILAALYGIYQVPAKLLGMPLFLDWLRNSRSLGQYDFDTAGWIAVVRATSIFAEPAAAAVPVIVLAILNLTVPASRFSKFIGWFATLGFALLTFSRTIWIGLGVAIAMFAVGKMRSVQKHINVVTPSLFVLLAIATPLVPLLSTSVTTSDDLSKQERVGSVVLAVRLIEQRPFIGSGWNSYETLLPQVSTSGLDIDPAAGPTHIHNMFLAYIEQAGIAGLILAFFPLIIIILSVNVPLEIRLASFFGFLVLGESADILYTALPWFWIAIVWKMNHNVSGAQIAEP
jgi:O-antigen ligase